MDPVTNVKNRVRAEQWASIIRECQSSTQTVSSWCAEHDVGIKAYYYWLRKFRLAAINASGNDLIVENSKAVPAVFKKLEVQSPVINTKAAVIIHLNGATVEVSEGASRQTIQAVLLALQSVC